VLYINTSRNTKLELHNRRPDKEENNVKRGASDNAMLQTHADGGNMDSCR
jgi:hypothetical protein